MGTREGDEAMPVFKSRRSYLSIDQVLELAEKHNIPWTDEVLSKMRHNGIGPEWSYFGADPIESNVRYDEGAIYEYWDKMLQSSPDTPVTNSQPLEVGQTGDLPLEGGKPKPSRTRSSPTRSLPPFHKRRKVLLGSRWRQHKNPKREAVVTFVPDPYVESARVGLEQIQSGRPTHTLLRGFHYAYDFISNPED